MFLFKLVVAGVPSVLFYLLFNLSGWLKQVRNKCGDEHPGRSYFWGLLFAGVYYYGFPIWWWRYGIKNTILLLLTCVTGGVICQEILLYIEVIKAEDHIASMIISIPIRVIAGTWVAILDERWRGAIENVRKNKSWPMIERLTLASEGLKRWRATACNCLSRRIISSQRGLTDIKDGKKGNTE